MIERSSALYSEYVIDGVQMSVTPARMLEECGCDMGDTAPEGQIVDETVDVAPAVSEYDSKLIDKYLSMTKNVARRTVPVPFAASYTCGRVANALIEAIWMNGHFALEDLSLRGEWRWNEKPIGNMAALYSSVEAASEYIDALGVQLTGCNYTGARECTLSFRAGLSDAPDMQDDDLAEDQDEQLRLGRKRLCPAQVSAVPTDWLIYIPFDPCDFRLGGSALSEAVGAGSSVAPEIFDADYFMDCYEVVRELIEDGIVISGVTVGDGGLITALDRMVTPETGAAISIADLRKAYSDEYPVRILFGEVPGVIISISDYDYDYVDAELLLQDVAFFPLGHPAPGQKGISVDTGSKTGVARILASLIQGQTSEGED
ncbi:MAG: hypothetical protein IK143_05550 [Bacteroidales bacterium]|nr:hypothetical protein [Bacteroidales bacterium]